EQFESFRFAEGVEKIEDVKPGMKLPGIVTNITAFGCFVDIGVHQDGLVHISELSGRFVKSPGDIVKVHQRVTVTVLDVDLQRKRISLSMKNGEPGTKTSQKKEEIMAAPKDMSKREKKEKGPRRFSNNPFYEAFRKK
ncbi:Transcription accessory protein (S1 RNA-binding domain), partial [hydrothermal vent metagenome]